MNQERLSILESLNSVLVYDFPKAKDSLAVISEAIETYKGDLWFSFNSGKDNTACFFLMAAVLYRRSNYKSTDFPIKCAYFEEEDPFDECEEYMQMITRNFKMELLVLKNTDNLAKSKFMKQEMKKLVAEKGVKAVVMGSRRTDPYCGLLSYVSKSSTEDGWPSFMRVNPIIKWEFNEIWNFFNSCKISYCSLYDKGYTYLGDRQDSVPNPVLRTRNGYYLPASAANTNFEPFSRKSVLKNLQTNEAGKILITELNIRHLFLRVEYDMTSEEIRKEFLANVKSFEIFQTILNESTENLKFDIDFHKAIRFATTATTKEQIPTEKKQDEMLTEILSNHISQLSQQLRVPIYILFLDLVRKNCVIFG